MTDDGQASRQTMQLIGYAAIATLKVVESQDLLKPGTPVKDISLVLGYLMVAIKHWPSGYREPEVSWSKAAISLLGVEECIQGFEEREEEEHYPGEDAPNWTRFSWKNKVRCLCFSFSSFSSSMQSPAWRTFISTHLRLRPWQTITAEQTPPQESATTNTTSPR